MKEFKDLFVPYKEAKEMMNLGFNEYCITTYLNGELQTGINDLFWFQHSLRSHPTQEFVSAPLYVQAFQFFREEYNLKGYIEPVEYTDGTPETYHWCIYNKFNSGYDQLTYKQAELECLRKLIELCKKNI